MGGFLITDPRSKDGRVSSSVWTHEAGGPSSPYSNHIILLSEHPFVNLNVSVEQCLNHRADLIRKAVKFANGLIDLFHLLVLG